MWSSIIVLLYLAGVVCCYVMLKEQDEDAITFRNRKADSPSKWIYYTRIDRFNNLIVSILSWLAVVLIVSKVVVVVFFDYNWKKPAKW